MTPSEIRLTTTVHIPTPVGIKALDPASVVLAWHDFKQTFDLGKFAYLRRDTKNRKRVNHVFDPNSRTASRDGFIERTISVLSAFSEESNWRPATQLATCRYLNLLLDWCDANKVIVDLDCPQSIYLAAKRFFKTLNAKVKSGKAHNNTASKCQKNIRRFFAAYFDDLDWGEGLPILQESSSSTNSTELPSEASQGLALAICEVLFESLSEFLLQEAHFPIRVEGPFGPDGAKDSIIFMANGETNRKNNRFWNALTGQPVSRNEVEAAYASDSWSAQNVKRMLRYLEKSVQDAKHPESLVRRQLGFLAAYCFAYVLMSQSGFNVQTHIDLNNPDNIEDFLDRFSTSTQGKRAIKWRANGRIVELDIPVAMVPQFRRYFQLRAYLDKANTVPSLLLGKNRSSTAICLSAAFVTQLRNWLKSLGVSFPGITSRQLRSAKHDHSIRTNAPETTAKQMGHSVETTRRKYSAGSEVTQVAEVGKFVSSMEDVLLRRHPSSPVTPSAVGACRSLHNPIPIAADVPVKPDCTTGEGCLFCKRLCIHPDETDLKKILSCRRCLRLTADAKQIEPDDPVFVAVMDRLDTFVELLRQEIPAELFDQVVREVDEFGYLDEFWQAKLDQLMDLSIL